MKRKHFLSSAASVLAVGLLPSAGSLPDEDMVFITPPYLRKGDIIGISSPAGFITREEIQPAILQLESWGYRVRIGNTIGKRDFTFGGTDEERAADLQQLMDDTAIRAILCARGGYGAVRIIDRLNWTRFKQSPKWVIGFSDITVIHSHLARNLGIASVHSKMCNSFPDDWSKAEPVQVETILSIRQALSGEKMRYTMPADPLNRIGTADGVLTGGNLKTLESLSGSASDIRTDGKILFVEDTGEYLYSLDRMFWNLKRSGKLARLKGLLIGGFKVKTDDVGEEFGKNLQTIILEKVKEYAYPVCFDFPVGHQKNNFAVKSGVMHRLEINNDGATLREI